MSRRNAISSRVSSTVKVSGDAIEIAESKAASCPS
jgi:hypothetical protein